MAACHFFCLAFLIALSFSTFHFALGARSLLVTSKLAEQSLFKPIPSKSKLSKTPILPKLKSSQKPRVEPILHKVEFLGFLNFKLYPKLKVLPSKIIKYIKKLLLKSLPFKFHNKKTYLKFKLHFNFELPKKKFPPLSPKVKSFDKPKLCPKFKFPPLSRKISKHLEQPLSTESPKTSQSTKQSLLPTISSIPRLPNVRFSPFTVAPPTFRDPYFPLVPSPPLTPPFPATTPTFRDPYPPLVPSPPLTPPFPASPTFRDPYLPPVPTVPLTPPFPATPAFRDRFLPPVPTVPLTPPPSSVKSSPATKSDAP